MTAVASTKGGRTYKEFAQRCLGLTSGHVVLDAGCGPGTDLLGLAEAVGPSGRVIGIDHDEKMLGAARLRVGDVPGVEIRPGDVHALPLPDASVDRARTDRVLQHVSDPERALAELLRVTKPGGRAVIAEPDWGTLIIDSPLEDVSSAFTRFTCEQVVRNAILGRQVGRLATAVGWSRSAVDGFTMTLTDFESADDILGLGRNSLNAVSAGYMATDERETWIAALADQPALAAMSMMVTTLTKAA
jgi:SAM-dependent methyltransferase